MRFSLLIIAALLGTLAQAETLQGNGVERGSVNFSNQGSTLSNGVKAAALEAIKSQCRITKRVKDFSLITMESNYSEENWLPYDVVYSLKFKIIYEDTWHRDWIQMKISEPYDLRAYPSTSYLHATLISLESVGGICKSIP